MYVVAANQNAFVKEAFRSPDQNFSLQTQVAGLQIQLLEEKKKRVAFEAGLDASDPFAIAEILDDKVSLILVLGVLELEASSLCP